MHDSLADVAVGFSFSFTVHLSCYHQPMVRSSLSRSRRCPCEIHCQWRNQWGIVDPSILTLSLSLPTPPFSNQHRHLPMALPARWNEWERAR